MSTISMDVPRFKINGNDLNNLLSFIYKKQFLLNEFGGIKIELDIDCKLALKKKRIKLNLQPITEAIVKINKDEGIYLVKKFNDIDQSIQEHQSFIDESNFWSSLSNPINEEYKLNISILLNESFFTRKKSHIYFDTRRLAKQSLVKYCDRKIRDQLVPYIKRSHGPGAIFPLSYVEGYCFLIDYHHQGGIHHWYIIPHSQRDALTKILNQNNILTCINHGKLFVDPSLLDKYNIRYHRIIQRPNEFVVLSSGILAQSFTEDASWTEAIPFILPTSFEQTSQNLSSSLCQCEIRQHFFRQQIPLNLFKPEIIQKYLNTDLHIIQCNKSFTIKEKDNYINIDTNIIPTSNTIQNNSYEDENLMSTKTKVILPFESIQTCSESSSTSLNWQSTNIGCSEKDKKDYNDNHPQITYQLLDEGVFCQSIDCKTLNATWIDSVFTDDLSESKTPTSELYQIASTSIDIDESLTNNCNLEDYFWLDRELMDFLPSIIDNPIVYEDIDMSLISTLELNLHVLTDDTSSHATTKDSQNQIIHDYKTLFVSGLKSEVTKKDICEQFTGCVKVTMKTCRATPHLKYAFLLHQTAQDAERNFHRPINYYLLGSECCVEYASDRSTTSIKHQDFDKKSLMIRRIPHNTSESDLYRLFVGCHIIKYYPARNINRRVTATETEKRNKILFGYAVIRYNSEEQAASVMKESNRYEINGQSLDISIYRKSKSLYATTSELFLD